MSPIGICLTDTALHPRSDFAGAPLAALTPGERVDVVRARGEWCRVVTGGGDEGFVPAEHLARPDAASRDRMLLADPALQACPVEALPERRLQASSGGAAQAVARAWNLYGSMLEQLATQVGIDPATAVAVLVVESSGQAFGPGGRVIIRFENHIFRRYLGPARAAEFNRHFQVGGDQPWMGHLYRRSAADPWSAFHGSQEREWDALTIARSLDERAALNSISMGLPQVMGFNHQHVGYAHPGHLLAFMGADVRYQLIALFDFIRGGQANSRAVTALRSGDYDTFASIYNGPGQARYYGDLIASHVEAHRALRPATSVPERTKEAAAGRSSGTGTTSSASGEMYVVRPGDTLGVIAGRFQTTVDAIAQLNGIADPNRIGVGQTLRMPQPSPPPEPIVVPSSPPEDVTPEGTPRAQESYVVQPGDTLGAIARRVGSTVPAIAEANAIRNVNVIFPGQVLAIPRSA